MNKRKLLGSNRTVWKQYFWSGNESDFLVSFFCFRRKLSANFNSHDTPANHQDTLSCGGFADFFQQLALSYFLSSALEIFVRVLLHTTSGKNQVVELKSFDFFSRIILVND